MKDPKQIAQEIFQFEMFDMFSEGDVIAVLKAADDLYFNDDEDSFISDAQYDALRLYASKTYPTAKYFLGVGAEVRGGKVDLPYPMGSLDQVQIGGINDWVTKWDLQLLLLLITDKLDGTSVLVIYDNAGRLKVAYSRGDGMQGADITRHIKFMVPPKVSKPMVVRGEAIIPKAEFEKAKLVAKTRSGNEYKNARNMVAGLMNASKNPQKVYDYINFVAYDIIDAPDNELVDKEDMLKGLQSEGFLIPSYHLVKGSDLNDDYLAGYLEDRREDTPYEIDGIVIDANDTSVRDRMNPTRDTLNPAYSIKYKVADASNLAVANVVAVHWALSKHGLWKPRIEIDPVDLVGVTITYCTGFNAQFIKDNNIGPGSEIEVTRSGDVIPFCQKVLKGSVASMPDGDNEWVGVDLRKKDYEGDEEVQIQRMVDFFSSIDAPLLKEGSIRKLYTWNHKTIESVIKMDHADFLNILGSNGDKVFHGLKKALTNIPLYKIAGAYSMERGIGVRRMRLLQNAMGKDNLLNCNSVAEIETQDGFDTITAELVIKALEKLRIFLGYVDGYVTIADDVDASGGALAGKKVVFTGFRDKTLSAQIEDSGGIMQSAVSGKTDIVVAPNPNATSAKLKKARTLGKLIINVDGMRGML